MPISKTSRICTSLTFGGLSALSTTALHAQVVAVDEFPSQMGVPPALAASGFSVQVAEMVENMNAAILAMDQSVSQIAIGLLFILLAADMVISFGRAVLGQAELSDVLQRFVFRLLFIGLVYFIIENAAEIIGWLGGVALSIVEEVSSARGESYIEPKPSNMLIEAVRDAADLFGEISLTSLSSLLFIFAALIRLVAGAVGAALLLITYVELYLIGILGMIALGFAGIEAGTGSAVAYIKTLIGKALKLVAISLIWIITKEISVSVVGSPPSFAEAATVILVQVLTIMLLIQLPPSIEQLSGGISSNMGSSAGSAVASGATKAAIIGTGVGAAAAAGATIAGAAGAAQAGAAGTGAVGTALGALKGGAAGAVQGGLSSGGRMAGAAVQGGARGVQAQTGRNVTRTMQNIQQKLSEMYSSGGSDNE